MHTFFSVAIPQYSGSSSIEATTAGATIPLMFTSSNNSPLTFTIAVGDSNFFSLDGNNLVIAPNHPIGNTFIQVALEYWIIH